MFLIAHGLVGQYLKSTRMHAARRCVLIFKGWGFVVKHQTLGNIVEQDLHCLTGDTFEEQIASAKVVYIMAQCFKIDLSRCYCLGFHFSPKTRGLS